ncbi:hypothetical protein EJ08DRAFT_581835 [Tothia fuscella]|uniref:C2H2-type domain-containing protein n=1 Tax=Tothia fuscella TaxID=1048955 RepID=A0A9P4U2M3_9PEZI|nr:hypothetical protein EJ08DRAFT_581835 [Tothia fuscella]
MGKKRRHPDIEEVLARPWCYYCERDFDDLKILISHQKAKHFKCERCGRRLNTAGGLAVHLNQVHKETLNAVDNSLPNRQGLEVEIFGMEGIPDDVRQQHDQRVTQQYYEALAERQAATGNPTPGVSGIANASKKTKLDDPQDLKARLAAFKAKKAAGATGNGSGNATPNSATQQLQSPAMAPLPMAGSPVQAFPPGGQASPLPPPGAMNPYAAPYPPPTGYGPPGYPVPGAAFPNYPGQLPYQPPYQGSQPVEMEAFNTAPPGFPTNGQAPPGAPPGAAPGAPGLPSRPAFSAPPVNPAQFQQMHHSQGAAPPGADGSPVNATSIDDLIASASKNASATVDTTVAAPEKKGKKDKDKDKTVKLLYDDVESPEAKMARSSRYAFTPDRTKSAAVA